jgi:hypothetical protein
MVARQVRLILKTLSIAVVNAASILTLIHAMHFTFYDDIVKFLNAMILFQRVNAKIGKYIQTDHKFL